MGDDKVTRFPINSDQRRKNRLGKRAVPCLVTDRWLDFEKQSGRVQGKNYIFVDVMTETEPGKKTKICNLCLAIEDILSALENVSPRP